MVFEIKEIEAEWRRCVRHKGGDLNRSDPKIKDEAVDII